jgi:hypothetical protein
MTYSSVSVKGRPALRVSTQVPICEIGNDGTYLNGLYLQNAATTGATYATSADLNPYQISRNSSSVASSWISPHVPLLSLAFDRYSVASLEFFYEPQSTATVEDRLVFAWTDDPNHPFLSANGAIHSGDVATQLQSLVTTDSVAFMPWKQWSLKVPVAQDERFMYNPGVLDPDEEDTSARFYDFGSMTCVATATPGTAAIYGILYVRLVLDLFDPVPIVSSVNSLVTSLHHARRVHSATRLRRDPEPPREGKTERKVPKPLSVATDTELELAPPRFRPLPSSAPGGSLYTSEPPTPPPVPAKRLSQK